ncbi:MAG: hypothetical protein FWC58_04190 [Desulfobulbus sp.]|nr:hypothetical protein [Desulfobulbus sp.]
MNPLPLHATITRCRHGQPLVEIRSEPFNGLEIRPADLRRLAARLIELAALSEAQPPSRWAKPVVLEDAA